MNYTVRMNKWKVAWIALAVVLLGLYVNGAMRQARLVNTDMAKTDQSAYMDYARSLAESRYRFVGGRNRMPIYPLLQSLVFRPGLSDEAFFERGKLFNIWLSVALLIAIGVLLDRFLPLVPAILLWLILTFTVFVFKAGFFQTELLFYALNFGCFLLLNKMLHRPQWPWALLTGIALGLGHLTKASVMVGLAVYIVVALLQERRRLWYGALGTESDISLEDRDIPPSQTTATRRDWKRFAQRVGIIALVVVVFLATISPYLMVSKRVFGHFFYNVNSTFYIWYDSWAEAKEGTRAHGDRVGWPDMPPEEIPTLTKYLREHSLKQIVERFVNGFRVTIREASRAYGYFKYFVLYLTFCLAVMAVHYQHTIALLKKHFYLWLFGLTYFGAYIFLYAFYVPISFGLRLTLAQFLPLMFSLSFILFRLYADKLYLPFQGRRIDLRVAFLSLTSVLVAYDIYAVLVHRIVTMYGGE